MTRSLILLLFASFLIAQTTDRPLIRQVEYVVQGTVHRASLTLKNADGGTEQKDVDVPFTLSFMAKTGSFLALSAQKTRYEIPDILSVRGAVRMIDDGVAGTVETLIKVNGMTIAKAKSDAAYGIASASGEVK